MFFLSPLSVAQAELQLRLALTTPRKAPLERKKGNTQHLLVSTCPGAPLSQSSCLCQSISQSVSPGRLPLCSLVSIRSVSVNQLVSQSWSSCACAPLSQSLGLCQSISQSVSPGRPALVLPCLNQVCVRQSVSQSVLVVLPWSSPVSIRSVSVRLSTNLLLSQYQLIKTG